MAITSGHLKADRFWRVLGWVTATLATSLFSILVIRYSGPKHWTRIDREAGSTEIPILSLDGKTLTVVIDVDGIFIGRFRLKPETAAQAIPVFIELNQIDSLKVLTTDRARYADFVAIIAAARSLKDYRLGINTVPFSGGFQPAISYFKNDDALCYPLEYSEEGEKLGIVDVPGSVDLESFVKAISLESKIQKQSPNK